MGRFSSPMTTTITSTDYIQFLIQNASRTKHLTTDEGSGMTTEAKYWLIGHGACEAAKGTKPLVWTTCTYVRSSIV